MAHPPVRKSPTATAVNLCPLPHRPATDHNNRQEPSLLPVDSPYVHTLDLYDTQARQDIARLLDCVRHYIEKEMRSYHLQENGIDNIHWVQAVQSRVRCVAMNIAPQQVDHCFQCLQRAVQAVREAQSATIRKQADSRQTPAPMENGTYSQAMAWIDVLATIEPHLNVYSVQQEIKRQLYNSPWTETLPATAAVWIEKAFQPATLSDSVTAQTAHQQLQK